MGTIQTRIRLSFLSFLVLLILYFSLGTLIAQTGALDKVDTFFDMDNNRVIRNMTVIDAREHFRTEVHPFFVLLVNPVGALLAGTLGSEILGALLLNALLGAFGVFLSFSFFRFFFDVPDAWLLASIFAFSSSQLLFSILPETATMAVITLLLTYILFVFTLRTGRISWFLWVLAGLLSFGVTITNFAQTLILFATALRFSDKQKKCIQCLFQAMKLSGITLFLAVILALIQKFCYPTSKLFFLPEIYQPGANVLRFVNLENLYQHPGKVAVQLFKYTFLINFFAPIPVLAGTRFAFSLSSEFSPLGVFGLLIWVFLWLYSLIGKWNSSNQDRASRYMVYGFLLCLIFNMVLHSVFYNAKFPGIEYFLYTGNFTFLVWAIWAILNQQFIRRLRPLLILLLLILAGNNLIVISQIVHAMNMFSSHG